MSNPELKTNSYGNMLLIMSGYKTKYIGYQLDSEAFGEGKLAFITSEKGNKLPVIVESLEKGKALIGLKDDDWKAAGHSSAESYAERIHTLGGDGSAASLQATREHVGNAHADIVTFRLATRKDLLQHLGGNAESSHDAKLILQEIQGPAKIAVQHTMDFAVNAHNTDEFTVYNRAQRAITAMDREIPARGNSGIAK